MYARKIHSLKEQIARNEEQIKEIEKNENGKKAGGMIEHREENIYWLKLELKKVQNQERQAKYRKANKGKERINCYISEEHKQMLMDYKLENWSIAEAIEHLIEAEYKKYSALDKLPKMEHEEEKPE